MTDADVDALLTFYDAGRRDEGSFEAGIQRALERLLVDPGVPVPRRARSGRRAPRLGVSRQRSRARLAAVVLPVEQHSGRRAARPGEPEAAQRAGRPRAAGAAAVRRSARARALVENFAGQWLELRNIREHTPDPDIFAEFDENLRDALRRETELFIDSQLPADRSVVDLLTADYTFVNERLARHYGIPDVYGERFRRVTLGRPRTTAGDCSARRAC